MTTQEKNAEIAKFMGYSLVKCNNGLAWDIGKSIPSKDHRLPIQGRLVTKDLDYLLFHSDWNWLHRAIDKIESLHYTVNISSSMVYINGDKGTIVKPVSIYIETGETKIKVTHEAVYQFVVWYNQQQK